MASAQTIRYVKEGGTGDGTSWASASGDLQAMIDVLAGTTTGGEVWVAAGTYKPTTGTDRTVSFRMKNNIAIYGGFEGTEKALSQRPAINLTTPSSTTLSGDIGTIGDNSDNSYHVIYNSGISNALMNGFVVTAGNANQNFTIYGNGGGIYNSNSTLTVANCVFTFNQAVAGGGMYNSSEQGNFQRPIVSNCSFISNNASSQGGGMYNLNSIPRVDNCSFKANTASQGGGVKNENSHGIFSNCSFTYNGGNGGNGGGMHNTVSNPELNNCDFISNTGGLGGGICNINSPSRLTNCSFTLNSAGSGGGIYSYQNGVDFILTNCSFTLNSAGSGGGMFNTSSMASLINCGFISNTASQNGGGIFNRATRANLTNCSFTSNDAAYGSAISGEYDSFYPPPVMTNCIAWGNGGSRTFHNSLTSMPTTVSYCLFDDAVTGYTGSNNIITTTSPFASDADLRLRACSPAINAGNNNSNRTSTDLAGNSRKVGTIDLGAYEYQETSGVPITFYADTDGDGYGDVSQTTRDCSAPVGYVVQAGDCDDNDASVYPGATEVCDGKDNNCDGQIDEGATLTFYADTDGDGYGDAAKTTQACSAPAGYVAQAGDCNDKDASIYPRAPEVCDGKDNNCDGQFDEGVTRTFYADADRDGYGDANNTIQACSAPVGYVVQAGDCDDNDAGVYPGATEVCDGKDNNCDGQIDEGATLTFYADTDGDGYGDAAQTTLACSAPSGYVANSGDCNDMDKTIYPNAPELCDGKDNNCDGQVDEGVKLTFYADTDRDGYGDANNTIQTCSAPVGYVVQAGDCDDNDAGVYPGATEVCDGKDNNCDGQIDEGVTITYYADADGDGYGDAAKTIQACSTPVGYVSNSADCNDTDKTIYPNAPEICDGKDNNCNGQIDEGLPGPAITLQPASTSTICAGSTASLVVAATGIDLKYQWYRTGSSNQPVTGATSASLTLSNAQTGDAGTYYCVVTGACGNPISTTSTGFTLTVNSATSITIPLPGTAVFCPGSNATLTIMTMGTNLQYQWFKDGKRMVGQTSATLTLPNFQNKDAGSYNCTITGSCGSVTSTACMLSLGSPTVITTQPIGSIATCPGNTVTALVSVSGTELQYQWYKDDLSDANRVVGQTTATLSLTNIQPTQAGTYYCVVVGKCGNAIASTGVVVSFKPATSIATQPASNSTVAPGSLVTISLMALGTNLKYQWYKDGAKIGGQTTATLKITKVTKSDEGNYTCVIVGDCGTVTSSAFALAVSNSATRIGVNEVAIPLEVDVYPNPAVTNTILVHIQGAAQKQIWLQIVDLTGRVLAEHSIKVQTHLHTEKLDISGSPTGMFLLRVSTSEQSQTRRLLKQ
ncbi:hypothetical protein GCM10023189_18740 [Nibrella saemangeumensis]|uniref:Ig-like domain-containing protein n=1 Tax=Nibrella saemangeumensis TaxID=1084526 RepID=A0ABP8MNG4_9BACT